MAFTPREFNQILTDMIAYVQVNTTFTDFSVGSAIRTVLEAAAFEDDEQYFQMVQLLDAFSVLLARGADLDLRVKDFNIFRQPAKAAFGRVVFQDNNLASDSVATDAPSGSTELVLFSTDGFPIPSPTFTIRVAEGSPREQDLTVTGHTPAGNLLTLSAPTTEVFSIGDTVSLITGAVGKTISAGESVQAPPTSTQFARTYITQETAFVEPGNVFSNEVTVVSVDVGSSGNVGSSRVKEFTGGFPFSGAGVIHLARIAGGVDEEDDPSLRARALDKIQSLSRGTPLALKTESIGVEDPATGQRVVSSSIQESLVDDEVRVFIDDGSGFTPDVVSLPSDSLSGLASASDTSVTLNDASDFPSSGFVLFEEGAGAAELVEYSIIVGNLLQLSSPLAFTHASSDIVSFVDVISESAETSQRRFKLQNFPVVSNTDRIFVKAPAGSWVQLVRNVDYLINKGTGEFELIDPAGLFSGTEVISSYNYFTNLVAEVQKVLEGDFDNPTAFPGVKAAGIHLSVDTPVIRRITVVASLSAEAGFSESDLVEPVRTAIESYIGSRGVGDDVIRTRMIDAAHDITGVRDIQITVPVGNITVLENELPVSSNESGDTLITIL